MYPVAASLLQHHRISALRLARTVEALTQRHHVPGRQLSVGERYKGSSSAGASGEVGEAGGQWCLDEQLVEGYVLRSAQAVVGQAHGAEVEHVVHAYDIAHRGTGRCG